MLKLTVDEVNLMVAGLGKLPLEQALAVYSKLRQQVEEQIKQPDQIKPGMTE